MSGHVVHSLGEIKMGNQAHIFGVARTKATVIVFSLAAVTIIVATITAAVEVVGGSRLSPAIVLLIVLVPRRVILVKATGVLCFFNHIHSRPH